MGSLAFQAFWRHEHFDLFIMLFRAYTNKRRNNCKDHPLLCEGWRDARNAAPCVDVDAEQSWTWKRGVNEARYDRAYIHSARGHQLDCVRFEILRGIWGPLTDHVAISVVLRRTALGSSAQAVAESGLAAFVPSRSLRRLDSEACVGAHAVPNSAAGDLSASRLLLFFSIAAHFSFLI